MTSKKRDLIEEIHAPARRNYVRRFVELKGLNDLWQIDIVEMIPFARVNHNYKYILMCINTFSKFGWAIPLKTKSAIEVTQAVKSILLQTVPPKLIQTDLGKEFYNSKFHALMNENKIKHYSTFTKLKASIVERWNRTIKTQIWKEFNMNGNHNWIDILDDIVEKYNHTKHSTTKMKPSDINKTNESLVLGRYRQRAGKISSAGKTDLNENDIVRISRNKMQFEKGYTPNWSVELFKVKKVNQTNPRTFLLEDMNGGEILGGFYREELKKTKLKNVYLIEKILKETKNRLYVKWLGFDSLQNSWINKKDVLK